jgi:hypothetical protein
VLAMRTALILGHHETTGQDDFGLSARLRVVAALRRASQVR